MIPFLLYMRYGDDNIQIIESVIKPKVLSIQKYYRYYLYWILLLTLGFAAVTSVVILFSNNSGLLRSGLFAVSIFTLCATLIQLFVVLRGIINKFFYAFIVYLLCLLALILINAPDSFLWFIYETEVENFLLNHWIGKSILLCIVTVINIARIQFHKSRVVSPSAL